MIKFTMAMIAALTIPVHAKASTSSDEYTQAIKARLSGNAPAALELLTRAEQKQPLNPYVKFEKGVALAELGKCAAAARTFNAGQSLTPLPSYKRATEDAMAHLCPRLAPFETSLNGSFVMDSNQNGGSDNSSFAVNGVTYQLSEEALSQSGSHFNGAARLAYNHKVSHRGYIVPEINISAKIYKDEDDTVITPGFGISYRYRGDKNDFRLGPALSWSLDGNGLKSTNVGLVGAGSYAINRTSSLSYYLSHTKSDLKRVVGDENVSVGSISYNKVINQGKQLVTLGYTHVHTDAVNYMNDLDQDIITASITGILNRKYGYEVFASHAWVSGVNIDPFFGVKRKDQILRAGVNISLPMAETFLGRPYVGVAFTDSKSSFATKNFENVSATFGITKNF